MSKGGIVCFCNPIIDFLSFVGDDFIKKHSKLHKNNSVVLTDEQLQKIVDDTEVSTQECGGSGINFARWLGLMGFRAGIVGQYGSDDKGQIVEKCLAECNLDNLCVKKNGSKTTTAYIWVTPDAQRSMCCMYAASHEEFAKPIPSEIIDSYEAVMMEGYQFLSPWTKEIALRVIDRSHQTKKKICLIISSVFQVPGYRESLLEVIDKLNIISGTQEEYFNLFGINNLEKLLAHLENSSYELCAVTMGNQGCYLVHQKRRIFVAAPDVQKVVDTTGAGDSFAAGLIYGYMTGMPIEQAAKLANFCAGYTISRVGVVFEPDMKDRLKELIGELSK